MSLDGGFPVQAAARMTGLTPDTLRAWERRYGAVVPRRVGRGRLYSREDITRLHLLRSAVQRGHAIGTIAELPNDAVARLLDEPVPFAAPAGADHDRPAVPAAGVAPPAAPGARAAAPMNDLTSALLAAMHAFDVPAVEREFGRLAAALTPRDLVLQVVLPALRTVGEAWQRGEVRPAQEHMLSGIFRHVLGGLLRALTPSNPSRRALFATPPGELHELGILSAALLAASAGVGVIYLGADLPLDEIVEAAMRTDVGVVVLGLTALPRAEARTQIEALRRALPRDIALWAGGPAATAVRGVQAAGLMDDFGPQLAAVLAADGSTDSTPQTTRA